jgi:hypothetical protein
MLAEMPKATGGKPYQATGSEVEPVERAPTLADLGIDKSEVVIPSGRMRMARPSGSSTSTSSPSLSTIMVTIVARRRRGRYWPKGLETDGLCDGRTPKQSGKPRQH